MKIPKYLGLDIHRDRIYITELSIDDNSVKQYEISTREKDLAAFLATLSKDDQVALESTRGSSYYVNRLSGLVASVSVANPSKLQFFTKNAKNDRNDSYTLALLLSLGMLPTVWTPDPETRQDREILSYRNNLIQQTTRLKNRIRAQMAEHGLSWDGSDIRSTCAQRFLLTLKHRLPWASQEVLANQLEELDLLGQRLKRLEPVIELRAGRWPEVALLMTIRGVNVLTAFTIMAVIGRIDRFEKRGQPGQLRRAVSASTLLRRQIAEREYHEGWLQEAALGPHGGSSEPVQNGRTLPQPLQTPRA